MLTLKSWHHSINRIRVLIGVPLQLYGTILYHFRDKVRFWSKIFILSAFDVPVRGSCRNIAKRFAVEKLEWLAYQIVEKVSLLLSTQYTNATDTQADRQTHRRRTTA